MPPLPPLFRTVAKVTAAASFATGLVTAGCGVYGARMINVSRKRFFDDDYFISPEALRLPYKQIGFTSSDGVELSGWYIEQTQRGKPSNRIAMFCNPYKHNKSTLLGIARGLWDAGYSVLLFDFRSHAPTPVKQESIGYLERRDGLAALQWLFKHKPEEARVGLVGASMGGAVSLMLSAEDPEVTGGELVCCATDCAFHNLKDVVAEIMKHRGISSFVSEVPFIQFVLLESICLANEIMYGYRLEDVGPKNCLDRIKLPLLIVHSELDEVVPVNAAYRIYTESATPEDNKELVIVPDTHHIGSYFKGEKQYIKRFVEFMDVQFSAVELQHNNDLFSKEIKHTREQLVVANKQQQQPPTDNTTVTGSPIDKLKEMGVLDIISPGDATADLAAASSASAAAATAAAAQNTSHINIKNNTNTSHNHNYDNKNNLKSNGSIEVGNGYIDSVTSTLSMAAGALAVQFGFSTANKATSKGSVGIDAGSASASSSSRVSTPRDLEIDVGGTTDKREVDGSLEGVDATEAKPSSLTGEKQRTERLAMIRHPSMMATPRNGNSSSTSTFSADETENPSK